MYNHLQHTLDVVGELSWVALENVCVQSEASTQATGRGRRGGGSAGRGGMEVEEVVVGLRLRPYAVVRMRMSQVTSTSNTSNSYWLPILVLLVVIYLDKYLSSEVYSHHSHTWYPILLVSQISMAEKRVGKVYMLNVS